LNQTEDRCEYAQFS